MQIRSRLLHLFCLIAVLSALSSPLFLPGTVTAKPDRLAWSIIETPHEGTNGLISTIVAPSEVNFIAVGADDLTIYAVDVSQSDSAQGTKSLYKSTDNGMTWNDYPSTQLHQKTLELEPGPFIFRIWNIAIAPDDATFLAAVTNNGLVDNPRQVYVSTDGGDNWDITNLVLPPGALISCIDISPTYGSNLRDITIGTRTGVAAGSVYVLKVPSVMGWVNQSAVPSWTPPSDVIALKFSPNYYGDGGLIAVISDGQGTYLQQGIRDTAGNSTTWRTLLFGAGLVELTDGPIHSSPPANKIITACIQLPSDFNATNPSYQRYYVSYDDNMFTDLSGNNHSGIYRVDYNIPFRLFYSIEKTRLSSIAFYGTYSEGVLLAGQVLADPVTGIADLWKSTDPVAITSPLMWTKALKPPTGGARITPSARYCANMQVAWNPSGNRVYSGTSSADLVDILNQPVWPAGYTNREQYDESAFSVSPYSTYYQQKREVFHKDLAIDYGNIWNQTGIIDTKISNISDVAVLQVPSASTGNYDVVYLSTSNVEPLPKAFDSVWRSAPDEIEGEKAVYRWERVSTINTNSSNLILRVYSGNSYISATTRSSALAVAASDSDFVLYSADEGQAWTKLLPAMTVRDMALENDNTLFIADDASVRKGTREPSSWKWSAPVSTGLTSAHTISALPFNAQATINGKRSDEWVIVGDSTLGKVAYCDFSGQYLGSGSSPRFESTFPLPINGETHVLVNDKLVQNRMIFAAVTDGSQGKIYRWVIGQQGPDWTEMQPINQVFYGIVTNRDILYGVWQKASGTGVQPPGVDRTLHSTQGIPPPPEWDDLTHYNLAPGINYNFPLSFNRQPAALKISAADDIDLWAIDNREFKWTETDRAGCLWAYTDTLARRGPFPSSPASGGITSFDTVSGRAGQINFQWFQLQDAGAYEMVAAKDEGFAKMLFDVLIAPFNQNAPSLIYLAGGEGIGGGFATTDLSANWNLNATAAGLSSGPMVLPSLESGHTYYWRVRAAGSIYGETIHSPWSATMYFTVLKGLPVTARSLGPALLSPKDGCGCTCNAPVNFSWSPYPNTTKYLFQLSTKPDMGAVLASNEVPGTAYQYAGKLKCGSSYYWRVRAVAPFPSDWSATYTFLTGSEAGPASPPATPTASQAFRNSAGIIMIMIGIGTLLFACVLILIMRTRNG